MYTWLTYDLHMIYMRVTLTIAGCLLVSTLYLFFNMFDCIGIGSFIVAAIGLNTSLGIDSFRWHCFTMPHYPDDHKMWCGNIPPALTMAGFMSIVLHSFGFSIRSFRWHCVFFYAACLSTPTPPRQFYLGGDRAGCCYRWCEHWIFSSTCWILSVAGLSL